MQKHETRKRLHLVVAPACNPAQPQLGPASLTASVIEAGHDCSIFDFNIKLFRSLPEQVELWNSASGQDFWLSQNEVERFFIAHRAVFHNLLNDALSGSPSAIGFSTWYTNMRMSLLLARELKRLAPGLPIILGGPEAGRMFRMPHLYNEEETRAVDLFVTGEGDLILPRLLSSLDNLDSLNDVPEIDYDPSRKRVTYKQRANLDNLPTPDFTSLDLGLYSGSGMLPLTTSRGCINRCIFCDEKKMWEIYRSRSAEAIFRDVVETKKRHPNLKTIDFGDSLINGNIKALREFAELMSGSDLGVSWGGNAVMRPEMDHDLLATMARGGCSHLVYGLESASHKVLKFVGKHFAGNADLDEIIKATAEAGIIAYVNFMFGLPGETEDDAEESIDFLRRNGARIFKVVPSFAFCNICPGTDAYDQPEKFGIKPHIHPWFWESTDGTNTYPVRLARFERFVRFVYDNGINSNYPYPEFMQRDRMLTQYYIFKDNREKALDHLEKAIQREPEEAMLSTLRDELKQAAKTSHDPSPSEDDDTINASADELVRRGEELFNAGDVDRAIRCFCLTLKKEPEHPEALNDLAVSFQARREYRKAELLFMKCLEVAPYHRDASENLRHLHSLMH